MARTVCLVLAAVVVSGCGDDESGTGGAGGASSSVTGSGAAGSGAQPGAGGSGGAGAVGGAGVGGVGGQVDPIADIAPVELVAGGFEFTEGPAWFAASGALLFTDIPPSRIHRLAPPQEITLAYEGSNGSNGLGVDPEGLLIACEHETRRVTRRLANDSIEVLAEEWQGQSLNSPNDNVVRSDGTVYFTDPPYGIQPGQQELAFQGVFRIAPDGTLSLVDDTMSRPNGVALSPDESTLYVADSEDALVRRWTVAADGSTSDGTKLVDLGGGGDGMAVDDDGNLYVTTSAGVEVYRPDGSAWGTIPVPEVPANCTFGGADRRTLYITARTSLYRVETNVPGKP